ncbi:LacI family DNA-binding transcriptional regulator [Leucobacter soli]
MLGNTGYDDDGVSEHYISGFSDLRPRGIFGMSVASGTRLPADTPFVFIHSVPEGVTAPSVRFDDLAGARTAVEHLIAHGYTDIHCLAGPHSEGQHGDGPGSLREQGWRQAMTAAGLATEGRIHRSSFDRVVVEGYARDMLGAGPWPRAVFATTDEQALAVLRAATAVGARVPEDIALAGFDGIREAMLGGVRLTTVRVPMEQLAARAFDLLDTLAAPSPDPACGAGAAVGAAAAEHVVFAGELVIGDTCGCPQAGATG